MAGDREYDMIEGYLDGTLQPESARELQRLAANDPELAAELKAEQAIRGTLARDVAAMPVAATEPSALLMTKLAATSGTSGGVAAAVGIARGSGVLGTIFGTGAGLTVVTIVALLGLALGAWLFAENAEVSLPQTERPVERFVGTEASAPVIRQEMKQKEQKAQQSDETTPRQTARSAAPRSAAPRRATLPSVEEQEDQKPSVDATPPATNPLKDPESTAEAMVRRLQETEKDPSIPTIEGSSSTITVKVEP